MYQLYIANKNYSSWSLRPWVLMRALEIPFEERLVNFDPGSNWEKFRAFAPNGKVPCLVDGQTIVWDSLAITEYLAESHGTVWPSDRNARAWARCASAEMHSGFGALRSACSMSCGVRVRLHRVDQDLQRDLDRIAELWREGITRFGGPYLGGSRFSAVDAFFAPVAFRIQTYQLELDDIARAYAQRLLDLPAMCEWYHAALAEPWREADHDAEVAKAGAILQDLRAC